MFIKSHLFWMKCLKVVYTVNLGREVRKKESLTSNRSFFSKDKARGKFLHFACVKNILAMFSLNHSDDTFFEAET